MKHLIYIILSIQFILCGCGNVFTVEVTNPSQIDRHPELIEVDLVEVISTLGLKDGAQFVISSKGEEVPYQITYDSKIIIPVSLKAEESQVFTFRKGKPAEYVTKVCGDHYPERVDDICWENDLVGFRVYGFKEDNPSGYDVFTKKNTDLPVIPKMYETALDPKQKAIEEHIRKEFGKDSAAIFHNKRSFHIDHGYGADFYAVGPTLGAGTAALLDVDKIVYPFCYDTYEILDNGPLRFTMKLTFRPFRIGNCDNVVESRIISIDLGSHFTKTVVSFDGLDSPAPIVTGIVVQDTDGKAFGDASKGYIAYPAPTMNFDKQKEVDNGIIYLGHAFPNELNKTGLTYFSESESKQRNGSKGHILAHSTYEPSVPFIYYWGFGWNGADMKSYEEWLQHLDTFAVQLRYPLEVKMN